MELWIRSQDRKLLEKAVMIKIGILEGTPVVVVNNDYVYGEYKTKERALEVLDKIQNKMKQQFIVKSSPVLSSKDIDIEEIRLKNKYNAEFIMQDSAFEIKPINVDFILYEMPKE